MLLAELHRSVNSPTISTPILYHKPVEKGFDFIKSNTLIAIVHVKQDAVCCIKLWRYVITWIDEWSAQCAVQSEDHLPPYTTLIWTFVASHVLHGHWAALPRFALRLLIIYISYFVVHHYLWLKWSIYRFDGTWICLRSIVSILPPLIARPPLRVCDTQMYFLEKPKSF